MAESAVYMNIGAALRNLSAEIRGETPGLDAQGLLSSVLGRPRTWLLAHPEAELSPEESRTLTDRFAELGRGTPLPYVLGRWEFFGLDFEITPDVLIPRPETELLVEHALDWLRDHPEQRALLDVGTGSGCIAVALASRLPDLHVLATDVSAAALSVARSNALRLGVADRIQFLQCDLLPMQTAARPVADRFGLIVANLPYIPTGALRELEVYNHEPTLALDGGPDGLDLIRRLLEHAPARLAPGGALMLEIEASRGERAFALARDIFPDNKIDIARDLAGRDRILEVRPREVHHPAARL